jgi:hypothetical protein
VPLGGRQLAGDDGRAGAIPIFEDLEEVVALRILDWREPPVIDEASCASSSTRSAEERKALVKHLAPYQWKRGQSGNPGGRSPIEAGAKAFTQAAVLHHASMLLGHCVSLDADGEIVVAEQPLNPPVPYARRQRDSANALLDRAMGRPSVHVEMGGKGVLEMLFSHPRGHDPLVNRGTVIDAQRSRSSGSSIPAAAANAAAPHVRPERVGRASARPRPQLPVRPDPVVPSKVPIRDDGDDDLVLIDDIPKHIVEDELPHRRWRRR